MKLLFFTSVTATHSQKWLRSLAAHFEVHVVSFRAPVAERIDGVTYHELLQAPTSTQVDQNVTRPTTGDVASVKKEAWLTFKNGIKFGRQFARVIDTVQPDVLHAHQSVPFGWYAVRARSFAKHTAPLIVSVWGTDVMAYPEQHWLFRLMNYSVLKRATVLTATSQALVAASLRWTKKRSWLVIPFGVEPTLFPTKPRVSDRARVVGIAKQLRFVGDLDVYGLETAIRAVALARRVQPEITLEIAGDGPRREYLQKLAKKLGVTGSVRFLGHVDQSQLGTVMARWDALLLPSVQESFGVVAVEAASVGIPVIGSRTGGIPEIVVDGQTGKLLQPMSTKQLARAILELDPQLLQSAHREGPKLVAQKFTWQKSVERMSQVYKTIATNA